MRLKKLLAAALSAVMVGSTASMVVSAKEVPTGKTYNYVALGDSIAAGYGLTKTGSLATDPALILNENLLANPVQEAYAAVFGTYLAELGEERGIATTTTNLSATAYRAEDIEQVILTEGYKGGIATWILETFCGEGASAPLANYHDIYQKYLSQADLVSIQLGGNDIVMGVLAPILTDTKNPILQAGGLSLALILFGSDAKTALGGGLMLLEQHKDEITEETVIEAAEFILSVQQNAELYVENAADNVQKVVDAVKSVNSDAEIALVGMFNPYGNSLEYNGRVYDVSNVITAIFSRAAAELCDEPAEIPEEDSIEEDITVLPEEEAAEKAEDFESNLVEIKSISAVLQQLKNNAKSGLAKLFKVIYDTYSEKLAKLVSIVAEEAAYPIQYMLAGKNVEPQMLSLNEKLQTIADEEGAVYVDVYGISNELNLDPHPTAEGHHEIADFMLDTLADTISDQMDAIDAAHPLNNISTVSKSTVKLGDKVKIRSVAEGGAGNYQYEVYYKKASSSKWSRVHDYSSYYAFNIIPAKATKYDVRVNIKDKNGDVATKFLSFEVTK